MTFFSRPNLDDTQFKQISGSTLTLDGSTVINSVTGLSIVDENSIQVPIIVTGGTNNKVLTYVDGEIVLKSMSGGTGSGVYSGASPTTCTVGGLSASSVIAGCSISSILQSILVPTISPTLTANSNTLTLSPSTTVFEVGCSIAFVANGVYRQGCVSPVYCSGPSVRTGLPSCYCYTDTFGVSCNVSSTSLSNTTTLTSHPITLGSQCVKLIVEYSAGCYPRKSDGTCVCSCCSAGATSAAQVSVTGVLPYFWGSSAVAPIVSCAACAQCLITSGTKCVSSSASDVVVTNYNVTGQYIWLAIPCASTTKTKWQGGNSSSNCGTIAGDLFNAETMSTISSPSSCWSSQCYKFYVSKYGTSINYSMTFKNS